MDAGSSSARWLKVRASLWPRAFAHLLHRTSRHPPNSVRRTLESVATDPLLSAIQPINADFTSARWLKAEARNQTHWPQASARLLHRTSQSRCRTKSAATTCGSVATDPSWSGTRPISADSTIALRQVPNQPSTLCQLRSLLWGRTPSVQMKSSHAQVDLSSHKTLTMAVHSFLALTRCQFRWLVRCTPRIALKSARPI